MTAVASHTKAQSSAATPSRGVAPPLRLTLIGKQLLALTRDRKLIQTLRRVADPAHEVYAAGSEIDLAGALMAHQTGVVVLDVAALASPAGQLAAQLHAQFPDIVLIVTGGAGDQVALSAQITDGSVHRFLHKPVSEQRVRLFVEAAWRRYAEGPGGPASMAAALAARAPRGAKWWLLAAGLAALAAPLLWVGLNAPPTPLRPAPATAGRSAASTAGDATLEALLARADHALAAGELAAPPGASGQVPWGRQRSDEKNGAREGQRYRGHLRSRPSRERWKTLSRTFDDHRPSRSEHLTAIRRQGHRRACSQSHMNVSAVFVGQTPRTVKGKGRAV